MGKDADDVALDEDTLECLSQAKKGKPRKFVAICKGPTIVSMVVYKKGNVQKFIKEAKESGRGQVFYGMIDGRGNDLNFKLARSDGFEKEPTRNAALKAFLEESDFKCKPIFEIVDSHGVVLDDDDPLHARFLSLRQSALEIADKHPESAERINALCLEIGRHLDLDERGPAELKVESLEQLLQQLSIPDAPPPPDADKDKFAARLKVMQPKITQVIVGAVSVSDQVRQLTSELSTAVSGKDFSAAGGLLDRIEPLVKQGLDELSAKAAESGDPAALFVARLKQLMPAIKQAAARRLARRSSRRPAKRACLRARRTMTPPMRCSTKSSKSWPMLAKRLGASTAAKSSNVLTHSAPS
jgi:hypothetical protein